jgi:hypothetical protein
VHHSARYPAGKRFYRVIDICFKFVHTHHPALRGTAAATRLKQTRKNLRPV